jgi:hypothetical protein
MPGSTLEKSSSSNKDCRTEIGQDPPQSKLVFHCDEDYYNICLFWQTFVTVTGSGVARNRATMSRSVVIFFFCLNRENGWGVRMPPPPLCLGYTNGSKFRFVCFFTKIDPRFDSFRSLGLVSTVSRPKTEPVDKRLKTSINLDCYRPSRPQWLY